MLSDGWDGLTRYEKGKAGESPGHEALKRVKATHPRTFWFHDNCKENGVDRGADYITSHGDIEFKQQRGDYGMSGPRFIDNVLARKDGFNPLYFVGFNPNLTPQAQELADEYLDGMLSIPYRVTPWTSVKNAAAMRRCIWFITHVVMHNPNTIVSMHSRSNVQELQRVWRKVSSRLHSLIESLRRAFRWVKKALTNLIMGEKRPLRDSEGYRHSRGG